MLGSIKVATIRGIPIRLHITLLAVFALLIVHWGALGILAGVLLFGSVLVHELGHSVVAQRYGIRIASIDLYLLGGMALMAQPPKNPKQEMWIAAAGPAVSLVIGASLTGIAILTGTSPSWVQPRLSDLLVYAAVTNLLMAMFNLVPALPMDGGRILRAALAARFGALRATRMAAFVSRCFAVAFVAFGLYRLYSWLMTHGTIDGFSWSLLIIGAFLFFMVSNEERVAEAQEAIRVRARALEALGNLGGLRFPTAEDGVVIDQEGNEVKETREEFIDPYGRRYVVITRLSES